ncbi:beta-N-acetylhexosaminidase [Ralstonia holmesii]|uniref:beta-N-acetylhexosaminidase n=1 Tax=Ralstonia holmesii TaxID=3058602 RepID=UPI0028F545AE|nr:beta-N-acetylhexosaminidase [Ralstonia sp. LMG 32967]CAJ0698396.1 Beta-hexosaminidase [Ralstonia sp. LMG 32967]
MTQTKKQKHPGPIVLDVAGLELGPDDVRRIAHPLTGGVILFARNFESRAQLTALTQAIRAIRSDVLICIDHEGGRVQRAKTDGFTHLPAMGALGKLWDTDVLAATRVATACGYVLAAELRACDIDLSFTPVLDLDYGSSSVIGDRAFHRDPRVVTMLANHLTLGLRLAGMSNCGKHFPGHGYVQADSHIAVPVDERPLEAILADDAQPYGWMGIGLQSVMPAHVIYSAVDPNPAGFSRFWLQDMLRAHFNFDGVIFSDDLSMEGASVAGTVVDGARAALTAGCDMVLICNAPEKADQLLGELDVPMGKASQRRVRRLFGGRAVKDWAKLQQQSAYKQALRTLREAKLIK